MTSYILAGKIQFYSRNRGYICAKFFAMKRKITLPLIIGVALIGLSASTVVNSTGISNWTGSPVDGGPGVNGQCSNCHSGGASTPTLAVTATPAFQGGNQYVPGQTYTITVTPSGSYAAYGFNCEIINSTSTTLSQVANFGTFGAGVTTNTQVYAASGGWPSCASHRSASSSAFKFKWTAPASGTGYIYADVLGVNSNGATSGDKVSGVSSLTLTPASSLGIDAHAESAGNLSLFPNPATDHIRISYTLNERGNVSLQLYSLNGELISELQNQVQERGAQSTEVHLPAGLAKGTYMVKLFVDGKQSTEKLMVM
jgi:hypothetical protein